MEEFARRHLASKARRLLWARTLCAASGRYSRAFCVQRSIKSRKSVSPKILSGTATGKLVGAVTHVLVNDPTRGYGIFIENMLDAAG